MSADDANVFARGEEFVQIFRRGAEFTKELLVENERLRRRLMDVQSRQESAAQDPEAWEKLRLELLERINTLEHENEDYRLRLSLVETENQQFAERYVEVEQENNNLANLYVASYQLHSTLDLDEVVKVAIEIVINLIGAECFAVYVLDEHTQHLKVVAGEGAELDEFPDFTLGQDAVGRSVASGEVVVTESASGELSDPLVCIPLEVQGRPIGAIAIHRLLQQKDGFSPLDHEMFTLLGGHAATALFAARLYSQSERKLNTIQGFLDLLTK